MTLSVDHNRIVQTPFGLWAEQELSDTLGVCVQDCSRQVGLISKQAND